MQQASTTTSSKSTLASKAITWIEQDVLPLWLKQGYNKEQGFFYENLDSKGQPTAEARRCMVQARQIYAFKTCLDLKKLGILSLTPQMAQEMLSAIQKGADHLIKNYQQSSGAYFHALGSDPAKDQPKNKMLDLYAQAFAVFGMACAHAVFPEAKYKQSALKVLAYLDRERKFPDGGYSEVNDGDNVRQSNPHMHLFEACLAWMEIDPDPIWKEHAANLLKLCQQKFIDAQSTLLAENFSNGWAITRETNGLFYFEPGHQYEWAWLMGRHSKLTGQSHLEIRRKLFEISEQYGVDRARNFAVDQVWNDLTVKKNTARFWPQAERCKIAAQLWEEFPTEPRYLQAAEQALESLFQYFNTPTPGLWYDTCEMVDGRTVFTPNYSKASSFYHIIGAISEYLLVLHRSQKAAK